MTDEIMAIGEWATNAALIADVARLGYIDETAEVFDATYGQGRWWKLYRPPSLLTNDIDKTTDAYWNYDVRALPGIWADRFGTVAFDPPYKLNGTPSGPMDDSYGVGHARSRTERHDLILGGLEGCARVCAPGGHLLVKVQDSVNSGKVRWQTDIVTGTACELGLDKVDSFLFRSHRPQPAGRRQQHARRNYSTLLVFQKGR